MGLGSRIRDPGSGKNLFRILDPGVKKALYPMHQVCLRRGLNPGRLCHKRALYLKSYEDSFYCE